MKQGMSTGYEHPHHQAFVTGVTRDLYSVRCSDLSHPLHDNHLLMLSSVCVMSKTNQQKVLILFLRQHLIILINNNYTGTPLIVFESCTLVTALSFKSAPQILYTQ